MNPKTGYYLLVVILAALSSCNASRQISKEANKFIQDSVMLPAHLGIIIYEPATGKRWFEYQSGKYFIPASNTKLFTLYAGLKFLGDSLPAARYEISGNETYIFPTGDPTFLHPDFKTHPLYNFLKSHPNFQVVKNAWRTDALGYGWAWDDYNDDYMAERSLLPMYGNVINIGWKNDSLSFSPYSSLQFGYDSKIPTEDLFKYSSREKIRLPENFFIRRAQQENVFEFTPSRNKFSPTAIPLRMKDRLVLDMLQDSLKNFKSGSLGFTSVQSFDPIRDIRLIRSQPSDSMFRLMMQRSDNFFAEQTLLMAANEKLGYLDEQKMIDTLLKKELAGLPQKPKWVDGSGLSRYNLFTPQSFVYLLEKMKSEFGFERLKNILPTGGQGTLSSYYKKDSTFIFAKTGTLSSHVALSGFLLTKKNKQLIFSIMVNSFPGGAIPVRKRIEKFLTLVRDSY